MTRQTRHRGPHPRDKQLFAPSEISLLSDACSDLAYLLSKGYPRESTLKLVGDRYALRQRQRTAIGRIVCSDQEKQSRQHRCIPLSIGLTLAIDGYNLITTIEAALAGAVVLRGRDGALRDLAGLKGSWRIVAETAPAVQLCMEFLNNSGIAKCTWYLDAPISQSQRLGHYLQQAANEHKLNLDVQLVRDPDTELIHSACTVVSSDSAILDGCSTWCNMAEAILGRISDAWIIDLNQ